eukprot:GFUD01074719.1.p1 GENE.GFUD01074719.1~~GFUD01074719.1.p1  ORF type:complete len:264 (+),score=71.13 GFUD01074719.1:55-792(+)
MASEKFCLRWNDFETNISDAFRELREDKDFFDVTLACDDNQIEAHKIILSACSGFFKTILKRNPHAHPLLYLKGVKTQNLRSLLDFMYLGKTNVAQDQVETFLTLGEELGVKGLVRTNDSESDKKQFRDEDAINLDDETVICSNKNESEQFLNEITKEIVEIIEIVKHGEQKEFLDDSTFIHEQKEKSPGTDQTLDMPEQLDETLDKTEHHLNQTFEETEVLDISALLDNTFDRTKLLDNTFEID